MGHHTPSNLIFLITLIISFTGGTKSLFLSLQPWVNESTVSVPVQENFELKRFNFPPRLFNVFYKTCLAKGIFNEIRVISAFFICFFNPCPIIKIN